MKVSSVSSFKNQYSVYNVFENNKKHNSYIESFGSSSVKKEIKSNAILIGGAAAAAASTVGLGTLLLTRGRHNTTPYIRSLAKHLSAELGRKICPKSLSSIILSKDELLKMLPKFTEQNYIASPENIKKGIFCIDLHSHTNLSDGLQSVTERLNDVAKYADSLYSISKKKFIYAITDHDTVEGVKEALKIIAEDPKKFKNVRFVPAAEISFSHSAPKSHNECEISEVLAYGINPYASKTKEFFGRIRDKRFSMIRNFIKDANDRLPNSYFNIKELNEFYNTDLYSNMHNVHWQVNHYLQTKQAVVRYAINTGVNPEELYVSIMSSNKGASLGELITKKVIPEKYKENESIKALRAKYEPHFADGKLIASSENTFEEIISSFENEHNVFFAFAHPAYFKDKTDAVNDVMSYFYNKSKGKILASESYHQAYNPTINKEEVSNLTDFTRNLKLLDLGGRDDHAARYL